MDRIKSTLYATKQKISELEWGSEEIKQREKEKGNTTKRLKDSDYRISGFSMNPIGISEGLTEKTGQKKIQRDNDWEFLEVSKGLNPEHRSIKYAKQHVIEKIESFISNIHRGKYCDRKFTNV